MTILPTGNNPLFSLVKKSGREKAFSFVEVMVTIGVLSFGLVLIYKAFFLSLNYLHHLNCRFYAVNILDTKISRLQKFLELRKDLRLDEKESNEKIIIDRQAVNFIFRSNLQNVDDAPGLYRVDASLSWREGAKSVKLLRAAYLIAYNPVKKIE